METKTTAIITYLTCPACDSGRIQNSLAAQDHTVSQESFEIWECERCSLRFTQHVPVESEIGDYYQSDEYISHSNTKKGLVNSLYHMVRNYTIRKKGRLIQKVSGKQSGKILDIGCGTGEFLAHMKTINWEVSGLEPDENARAQVLANHGITVRSPEKLFELADDQFDVITMWHVLEHVHKLQEYMQKIRRLLKAGGTLIIAVPNYQSKDAEIYDQHWAAYDVPRHLYHFSPDAMKRLLGIHSFQLERMMPMPFDSFYVSLLSEKYANGKARLFPGFISGLKSYLHTLGKPERCSSVMYIIS